MKCEHCGAEFEPRQPHQKYCSVQCRHRAQHERTYKPRPIEKKICVVCGKEFETRHAAKKYCSPECYRAAFPSKYKKHNLRQATCPVCGAQFETNKPNQIYCSRLCNRAAEHRRRALARRGMSCLEKFIPPAKPAAEVVAEPQPTPIDDIFPPFHFPREVVIPAAIEQNRQPTVEEILDWIFEERSA